MKASILYLLMLFGCLKMAAQTSTIYQAMLQLQRIHHVHFLYNSALNLNRPYNDPDVSAIELKRALDNVFTKNGIDYTRFGSNIMLKQDKRLPYKFVLKGVVRDSLGEPLANVSLFDRTTQTGTLTSEHGRYTLILNEGVHHIDVSWFGQRQKTLEVNLFKETHLDVVVGGAMELKEVVVSADLNSPLNTTSTGKLTLRPEDIKTEFALLSSPDLVKTLQGTSGVAQGTELSGGLLVHGGSPDENLFLLDGSPIYQTNHSLGLFSAFNADIIKNVDFYKSGFPARFSGRVSSITDVRTGDGNATAHHGSFSLGLIDGRFHLEGPIVKGKTSYNIALRRSWIDLLLVPAYALINRSKGDGTRFKLNYAFHDFNAKVTHRLKHGNKLWLSLYSGKDSYGIIDENSWSNYQTTTDTKFRWGNLSATLAADFQLSDRLSNSTALIAAYSFTRQNMQEDDVFFTDRGIRHRNSLDIRDNRTRMEDVGFKTDFIFIPHPKHSIRFGGQLTFHHFNPQTINQSFFLGDPTEHVDTTGVAERTKMSAFEAQLYAEDDIAFNPRFNINAGASTTAYRVSDKTFLSFDPRLSLRFHPTAPLTFKLSYTHMSQSIHRIASTFLDVPSDFWVPSTAQIPLVTSHQMAAGIYSQWGSLFVSVEGYLKLSNNLLQYRHWMGLQPPAAFWEENVTRGQGRAYGVELDARYRLRRVSFQANYTLSWSKRRFPELFGGWFDDQFDNRHRLNLRVRTTLTSKVSAYAALALRSGNRVSFPVATAVDPMLPGDRNVRQLAFVYGNPNNLSLPLYHRLDLGFNFKHTTKRGREAIWNVSVYNAYCHLNTMYAKLMQTDDGRWKVQAKGYIPIIPSVSYTINF